MDGGDASSDDSAEWAPHLEPKVKKRLTSEEKTARTREQAAGIILARQSMGDHLSSHGYTRPEPGHSGPRTLRRKESKESSINQEEVAHWVRTGRKQFKTYPSHFPQRGSCFLVAFVGAVLMGILFDTRPDLLRLPLGQWSADGTRALGLLLWNDGRKFPTDEIPPAPLFRTRDMASGAMVVLNEAVVMRFMDMKHPHCGIANVLMGHYFVRAEDVATIKDIISTMNLNHQLRLLAEVAMTRFGVPVVYWSSNDLHMQRILLKYTLTDHCPFCECNPDERLLDAIPFENFLYDGDHMSTGIILNLLLSIWSCLLPTLQWHFQRYVQNSMRAMKSWKPGEFGSVWRSMKEYIGWARPKATNDEEDDDEDNDGDRTPGPCPLLNVVAVAKTPFNFPRPNELTTLVMRIICAIFILAGKCFNDAKRIQFCSEVAGIVQLWELCFGVAAPICLHILEVHWPRWMMRVIPFFARGEGGERLNEPHSVAHEEKTTRYRPVAGQLIKGPPGVPWVPYYPAVPKSGADTLLEIFSGDWWVAKEKLRGGWPNWR